MRTVPIYKSSMGHVVFLPADMAYEGVAELAVSRNGDVVTLRPVHPSWASFPELPKANADSLQERPVIMGDDGHNPYKEKRLGFLSGQFSVTNDFDRVAGQGRQLEQLGRVASVSLLAAEVLEDKEAAAVAWLSRSNEALGGQVPILLCETEAGAEQVQRVLYALEWGGPV
ncbi:antitoxin Xre/MbcA/ParS toxin-binding domain-containing protein [Halomonas sp. NO4]|uniref:antitoxin Xre/MbcA/ParS toxin-binding domain-containing protein n=1 Tax=Halomonas sp. NO4 TaxID=2484813 RepID=UPI001969CDFD|nr:antitoxin Xre/MbcA/ParS toxin-binding domain-containing protein [Halomonas sp. NO4]